MAVEKLAQLAVDIVINARRAKAQLANFRGDLRRSTDATRNLSRTIGTIGLAASAFLLVRRAVGLFTDAITAAVTSSIKLEKQITDIAKISGADFGGLSKGFIELGRTLPTSFNLIAAAGAAAARAGTQNVEALTELTKQATILSQVSGDITPVEAVEGLARLRVNLGFTFEEVQNVAAGIDALSDSFVTTSGQIVKTSARLAGFANSARISIEDLNALSAALLSTGVSATVVRTSVTRLLIALQSDPLKAAKALKLSADETEKFFTIIRTDTVEGIKEFIKALDQLGFGEQQEGLVDLGVSSSRTQSVIQILKSTLGQLEKAQKISNEETRKGTNLLNKLFLEIQTGKGRVTILKNEWEFFKASLVDSEVIINTLVGSLQLLSKAVLDLEGPLDAKTPRIIPETDINILKQQRDIVREIFKLTSPKKTSLFSFEDSSGLGFILAQSKKLGKIKGLERQFAILQDKRVQLAKQEILDVAQLRDRGLTAEEIAQQKVVFFREAQEELRVKILRNIQDLASEFSPIILDPLQAGLARLQDRLAKVQAVFDEQDALTRRALIPAMRIFRKSITASSDALREADAKRKRTQEAGNLEPLLGPLGGPLRQIIQINEALAQTVGKGNVELQNAILKIANETILGKKAKQPAQFVGFTQAWEDAITRTQPKDKLLKERLVVAKQILKITEVIGANGDKVFKILERVAEILAGEEGIQ